MPPDLRPNFDASLQHLVQAIVTVLAVINPVVSPLGKTAIGWIARVPRLFLAASTLALLVVATSGHAGYARDRLSGDVERVKMIGFTVVASSSTTWFIRRPPRHSSSRSPSSVTSPSASRPM